MPPENGSTPAQPAAAPATPTEQPAAAPAPSAEVTPAPAPAPAEGQPAQEPKPAEPAPSTPEAPRESAVQKRARELREKAAGQTALANKLDPQTPVTAPQPTPPAPTAPQTPNYVTDDGSLDIDALERHIDAKAEEKARKVYQDREAANAVYAERSRYVSSVESDAQYLASNVGELNPKSPQYNADLDNEIEAAYRRATTDSQGNVIRTDISLREFAEAEVKRYRKWATAAGAAVPNAEAGKQLDGAAAPSTAKSAEKPFNKLSRAEMEKKLGFATPQSK